MVEHAAVVNVSRYRPARGKRDDLVKAMQRMAERASSAEGCFGAQACQSDQDRETLVAVSRWKSEAALDAFSKTAESVSEKEHMDRLLDGPARRENLTPF